MDPAAVSEELAHIDGQIADILRALSNGFQKLEKIKDPARRSRQLEELTEKMRECKRLIKDFEREAKESGPDGSKMVHERRQTMIKELNSFVALKKQYASSLENKRVDLFDVPGGGEGFGGENDLLASKSNARSGNRRKRVDGYLGDQPQRSPISSGVTTYSVDAACTHFACSYSVTRQLHPHIDLSFKVGTINSTRLDWAEANAILEALFRALSLMENEIHIHSDCLSIVLFLQGGMESWPWWLATIPFKCKEAISKFKSATISHIRRSYKFIPYHLAKWTLQHMHNGFLSKLPDQVQHQCQLGDDQLVY